MSRTVIVKVRPGVAESIRVEMHPGGNISLYQGDCFRSGVLLDDHIYFDRGAAEKLLITLDLLLGDNE